MESPSIYIFTLAALLANILLKVELQLFSLLGSDFSEPNSDRLRIILKTFCEKISLLSSHSLTPPRSTMSITRAAKAAAEAAAVIAAATAAAL